MLVADDHPVLAEALARLLDSDDEFEVVAWCTSGDTAVAAIFAQTPDVAVLDVGLPVVDGPAIAGELARATWPTRVLFMSGRDDTETVRRCAAAHGHGFVSKAAPRALLRSAIADVARGGTSFPPTAADPPPDPDERVDGYALSSQERRVLELSADGLSAAEIASALYIGQTTVKTHLRHAADKLGVRGKTAAIAAAMRRGLIE